MLSSDRSHFFMFCLLAVVLCGAWFSSDTYAGDPLGFSSSWNYRESGGEDEGSRQFTDNYNLTYSKELSAAMTFAGSVRYNKSRPSSGNDSYSLNPNLSFDLRNDLFSLNLNASQSESGQKGAATRTTDSWGLNLNSQIEDWPSLRLYFNQSTSTDDSNPAQVDNDSNTVGVSIEHSFELIDLLYDVRAAKSSDNINSSDSETFDQTAQISYAQSFFAGRVSVSASQQFQITENSSTQVVGTGNLFYPELNILGRFYEEGGVPTTAPLGTVSFQGVDIFSTSDDQNMSIRVDSQPVKRLQVWFDRELTNAQLLDMAGGSAWTVYRSNNSLGTSWTQIAGVVRSDAVVFDPLDNTDKTVVTLLLPAVESVDYIRVVADTLTDAPGLIEDIIPQEERIAASDVVSLSRETKNMQTQFSTSVRVTDKWSVSYSLRRAQDQQDSGDSVQFNHSLSSSYTLNEKVSFSASVSENTDEADNSAGRQSRSFSLAMSAQPLSTLNVSLGYTRSESESDDGQNTVSNSISSSLNATIYPDLTASMTGNLSKSENIAEGTESSSFGLTLNTTAYFTPKVDMNTNLSYTESDSSGGETTQATSYGMTLGYRPSDMLLLNFSYDGDVEEGSSSFSGNSSWLWSKKLQSQFGLSYDFGEEASQQYNALLSWLINRSLSFQTSGNYQMAEDSNSWNSNASLNMIF